MASASLAWLGLSESKVAETLKNAQLTQQLCSIVETTKKILEERGMKTEELPKQKGNLLYHIGTKAKAQCAHHLPAVIQLIVADKIDSEIKVTAAVSYILANALGALNQAELEKECGAGVVVSDDEIEDKVKELITANKAEILKLRYHFPIGKLLGDVRASLKWADGLYVKKEVDLQLHELLGPRTEEDLKPRKVEKTAKGPAEKGAEEKGKKTKAGSPPSTENSTVDDGVNGVEEDGAVSMEELIRTRVRLHLPGENYKTEGYQVTPKTNEILAKHLKRTGGKVLTRFPPEPNGLLHIGHAKAININFGYAKAHNGMCNLRFDDTNPEKEEKKFFDGIEEMVRWLGYTPAKITYSSENFQQLYEWAVALIKKGLAYVCHQTMEEMRGIDVKPSPWRDRPIQESLALFEDMRKGKLDEGEATLRLKVTLEEGKQDPVAYRIKYVAHHRSGSKWCIYPTYDYTHCLCDSIEDITHSLCTKEFQSRRSSYYWLCNALDIYCPVQWEYGRLNVNYTVVSKRKILKLITSKIVRDWDDPRLFTLAALRRRGVPPEAINRFVARLGVTGSQMVVDPHVLDSAIRDELNGTAPRTMAVLYPIRVRITNWKELKVASRVEVPDFPSDPSSSKHSVAIGETVFIERDDYREGDDAPKDFRRLTQTQPVALKHIGLVLSVVAEKKDASGRITELECRADLPSEKTKPKAFIHWVSDPVKVQVRLYDQLFHHKNPEDPAVVPGGFLSDCNENSLTTLHGVLVDKYLPAKLAIYDSVQFERVGFFAVDPDSSSGGKLVFNRTVLLKEGASSKS